MCDSSVDVHRTDCICCIFNFAFILFGRYGYYIFFFYFIWSISIFRRCHCRVESFSHVQSGSGSRTLVFDSLTIEYVLHAQFPHIAKSTAHTMATRIEFKCISAACTKWLIIVDLFATMRFIRNSNGPAAAAAAAVDSNSSSKNKKQKKTKCAQKMKNQIKSSINSQTEIEFEMNRNDSVLSIRRRSLFLYRSHLKTNTIRVN